MNDRDRKDPGLLEIERARRECEIARRRLSSTMGALQYRLKPGTLANDAWTGVKEKSGAIADGALQAVKERPVTASGIFAGLVLFLARDSLWSVASRFFRGEDGSDLVTTTLSKKDDSYDLAAPAVSRSAKQGASA